MLFGHAQRRPISALRKSHQINTEQMKLRGRSDYMTDGAIYVPEKKIVVSLQPTFSWLGKLVALMMN